MNEFLPEEIPYYEEEPNEDEISETPGHFQLAGPSQMNT